MRSRLVLTLILGSAVTAAAGVAAHAKDSDYEPVQFIAGTAIAEEAWDGRVAIPSGYVKWAGWGDLRVLIKRKDTGLTMEVFSAVEKPVIPTKRTRPPKPVWLPERQVLKVKEEWTSISDPNVRTAFLDQGDDVLALGIHEDPEKKGGAVLYWQFSAPPSLDYPLAKPWSLNDGKILLKRWKVELPPQEIPFIKGKRKETWIVARKGKTVVAALRYQPAGVGGDPFARWFCAVSPEAVEDAKGEVSLVGEVPNKKMRKFMKERAPSAWDPRTVVVVIGVGDQEFMIRIAEDEELGTVYEVIEKPVK